ncbi:MAG: hypothetical protein K9N55_04275 [Phycisphaerae bacterium]|nr:hypothetical protein [Phycisphaerae bacterium]
MNTRLLIMLMVILAVFQCAAGAGDEDFTLTSSDPLLIVTTPYVQGFMSGNSAVDIQPGGSVAQLYADCVAEGLNNVMLTGGSAGDVSVYGRTHVSLSSGSVASLYAAGASSVTISGGAVTDYLGAWDQSDIELTGGVIADLDAGGSSEVTFYAYDWAVTDGLSILGDEVFGTGILSGTWSDGTVWSTNIIYHAETATIKLVTISNPCGECRGKVSELILRYTGTAAATVTVEQKGDKAKKGKKSYKGKKKKKGHESKRGGDVSEGVVVFEGVLEADDLFQFFGLDDKGTLGTEISIFINGTLNTKIHTSCSRPIYPGMISGLFEVVEGVSLEGGLICPLGSEPPDEGSRCD